jgi:hypothetical protein
VTPTVDLTFPHNWTADILPARPLILPKRQYVYPRRAEEVERGAMEILVRPVQGDPFLATCALGFADPAAPTGIWSCPHPDWLCAVSGGYAYLIDTTHPERFEQVEYRPVLEVRPVQIHTIQEHDLLLFVGHHSLLAWGTSGKAWQTQRLSAEGVTITGIEGDRLLGTGWDLLTDTDIPFAIDLRTGHRIEV